jgi:hypothetical protein
MNMIGFVDIILNSLGEIFKKELGKDRGLNISISPVENRKP